MIAQYDPWGEGLSLGRARSVQDRFAVRLCGEIHSNRNGMLRGRAYRPRLVHELTNIASDSAMLPSPTNERTLVATVPPPACIAGH